MAAVAPLRRALDGLSPWSPEAGGIERASVDDCAAGSSSTTCRRAEDAEIRPHAAIERGRSAVSEGHMPTYFDIEVSLPTVYPL